VNVVTCDEAVLHEAGLKGNPVEVGDRGVDGHQPIPVSTGGDYNYREGAGLIAGLSSSS